MSQDQFSQHPTARPTPGPDEEAPRPREPGPGHGKRGQMIAGAALGLVIAFSLALLVAPPGPAPLRTLALVVIPLVGLAAGGLLAGYLHQASVARGVHVAARALPRQDDPVPPKPPRVPLPTAIVTKLRTVGLTLRPDAIRVDRLRGHRQAVSGLAVSPDERLAASCSVEGDVAVQALASGVELWGGRCLSRGVALAISPDGLLLAVGGAWGPAREGSPRAVVQLFELYTGQELRRIECPEQTMSLAFLPDSRHLVLGNWGALRLWELEGLAEQSAVPLRGSAGWLATECPTALAAAGPGLVVVGTLESQEARVLDLGSGEAVRRFAGHWARFTLLGLNTVTSVALSPGGDDVLSGGLDGTARIWSLRSGRERLCFARHRGWWGWHGVTGVAWLPGGNEALSAGEDGTLRRWDATTGAEIACHPHGVAIRKLSAAGRTAITGGRDGSIRVWYS